MALAIAIVIWAYANEGQSPRVSRELRLPLDVRKVEPGCVVTSAPKTVKVLLEGGRTHVNSAAAEPDAITAYVNLRGKASGRHVMPVIVRLPEGFTGLVSGTPVPSEVPIRLGEKVQRTLKINVQFVGSPPVGYQFGAPQLSPSRAVVSGTAEHVNAVARLVAAVDTGGSPAGSIDGDFLVIAQGKDGEHVHGVDVTPEKVHLRMELLEAPASRAVFVSLDVVGQPPFPYKVSSVEVHPQTVTVVGRPERLMKVTTLRTEPVQLANRTKTFSQSVRVIAPPDLTLADGDYVRVTVRIASPAEPEAPASEPSVRD